MLRLTVPATSANLGPGFDSLGVALNLYNTFSLRLEGNSPDVRVTGEGAASLSTNADNLVLRVMEEQLRALDLSMPSGFVLETHNQVPVSSGLGSSSTATVAGVLFARAYANVCSGKAADSLNVDKLVEAAARLEGHGDNVAPALLGGLILVSMDDEGVIAERLACPAWKVVVVVPEFDFSTTVARSLLPDAYSRADATFAAGRAALIPYALESGQERLLKRAMMDVLHEPYRYPRIPGATEAKKAGLEKGALAVCLSGAGPGLLAFCEHGKGVGEAMVDAFADAGLNSRFWELEFTRTGTTIEVI